MKTTRLKMHRLKMLELSNSKIYTYIKMQSRIEELLKRANSSDEGDASVNSATRTFPTVSESSAFFDDVKSRLFRIDKWNARSSSGYALFDESGSKIGDGHITAGSFIRISVPATGKYDWVRVIDIHETPEELVLTVKPAHDPTAETPDPSVISHFFHGAARNNFCVQLNEKSVAFYVIGINERQNTGETENIVESVRNAAVANIGYYTGIQKAMWDEFCTNFLKTEAEQ